MTKVAPEGGGADREGKDQPAELDTYRKGKKMTYERQRRHYWPRPAGHGHSGDGSVSTRPPTTS